MEKQFSETLNTSGVAVPKNMRNYDDSRSSMSPEKLLIEEERLEEGYANAKTEAMTKVDEKSTLLISHPEIK
jgi:hypothetical protein